MNKPTNPGSSLPSSSSALGARGRRDDTIWPHGGAAWAALLHVALAEIESIEAKEATARALMCLRFGERDEEDTVRRSSSSTETTATKTTPAVTTPTETTPTRATPTRATPPETTPTGEPLPLVQEAVVAAGRQGRGRRAAMGTAHHRPLSKKTAQEHRAAAKILEDCVPRPGGPCAGCTKSRRRCVVARSGRRTRCYPCVKNKEKCAGMEER